MSEPTPSTSTTTTSSRHLIIEDLLRLKFPLYSLAIGLSVLNEEYRANFKKMQAEREAERASLNALPDSEFQALWTRHLAQQAANRSARKDESEQYRAHIAARKAAISGEAESPQSKAPAKPTAVAPAEDFILKRAALVRKHERAWPSIDGDLRHANENGLSTAAKAEGHGLWFEERALKWASKKGKLMGSSAHPNHPANAPFGQVHRMDD